MKDEIERLHRIYVADTGREISLNMETERQWWDWCNYRRERPFTKEDLQRVIFHLQKQIRLGKRNQGALKFRNLIGMPDQFEDDLEQIASQKLRDQPPRAETRAEVPIDQRIKVDFDEIRKQL